MVEGVDLQFWLDPTKKNTNKIDMIVRSVLSPLITLIKMHSQSLESQKKRKREKCCVGL